MFRGFLMFRGVPDIRGPLTIWRAPDSQRALTSRGTLILREPLICIGPLTIGKAPDIQKDH